MNELYQGTLDKDNVETAIEELKKIQLELKRLVRIRWFGILTILSNQPPWGKNISNDITNLSNYFCDKRWRRLHYDIFQRLGKSKKMQMDLTIESV